jgi:hypothetical protein
MRFLLASLVLVACGEGLQDDGSLDGMVRDALDSGGGVDAEVSDVDAGAEENPLAPYADEFEDPATLADWTAVNGDLGNVEVVDGRLVFTATAAGQWHNDRESFFLVRGTIEGDFIMRARVRALLAADPSLPPYLEFNAIGVLARDPAGDASPETWAMQNAGFQSSGLGTRSAFTYGGNTIQEIRATSGTELDIVLCRIGNRFRMYYLTPEYPDLWTNSGFYERPSFPAALQVGIAIDALGQQPHLRGEVDWVRFAVPATFDDCTVDIPAAQ